jgi:hypothetical protein
VSFNNSTSPADETYTGSTLAPGQVPKFTDIPGNVDLLYWDSGETVVNDRQVLPVRFEHKFSQLSLKVSCKYNGWPVTVANAAKITLASRANTATLFAKGSLLGVGTVDNTAFTWPSSGTDTVISNPSVFYMAGITPAIRLSQYALTINGAQVPSAAGYKDYSFSAAAPLVAGKHYTLTLKLKTPKFANSNVYWDGSKLTFDAYIDSTANPTGYVANKTQQQKQGVHFKWGSLIGISAPGRAGGDYTWSNDTCSIFVPDDPTNPTTDHGSWIRMTNALAVDSAKWGADYAGIPYVDDDPIPYGTNTNYLNTLHNSPSRISAYTGDICHYLDKDYRMPYATEFGNNGAWQHLPSATSLATDFSGRSEIPEIYCATLRINNMFFPASGHHYHTGGGIRKIGNIGYYWSSSAASGEFGYSLLLQSGVTTVANNDRRYLGNAVRCVLRE